MADGSYHAKFEIDITEGLIENLALYKSKSMRIGDKVVIKSHGPFLANVIFPAEVLGCVGTCVKGGKCCTVDFNGRKLRLSSGWLMKADRITGRLRIGDI